MDDIKRTRPPRNRIEEALRYAPTPTVISTPPKRFAPEPPPMKQHPKGESRKGYRIAVVSALIFFIVLCAGGFAIYRRIHAAPPTSADVIAAVGKLVELPPETPTVAMISDLTPLKGNPFFAQAHVG